jgi:hypothetical protein
MSAARFGCLNTFAIKDKNIFLNHSLKNARKSNKKMEIFGTTWYYTNSGCDV